MRLTWFKYAVVVCLLVGVAARDDLTNHRATASEIEPESVAVPAEVQSLAREYRIEVYRSFRLDRPEFDRRRRVAAEVYSAWLDAGARKSDVPKLAEWIRQARASSIAGAIRPLPPVPEFGLPVPDPVPRVALKPAVPGALDHAPNVRPRPPRAQGPDVLGARTAPIIKSQAALVNPAPTLQSNPAPPTGAVPVRQPATVVVAPVVPPQPPTRVAHGPQRNPFPLDEKLDEAVEVNLVELEARVAGFNRALQTLENRLLADKVRTPGELTAIFAELDELVIKEGDLQIYLNLLEPAVRRNVRAPQSIARAKTLLQTRIAETRQQTIADFPDDPTELRLRTQALDALERRLKSE